MTFYWWSHWFWITLILTVNLLFSHVHTYPSQEAESLASSPHPHPQPVRTTKLYQTTVTQTWGPATQSNIMDLTHRPTTSRPAVTTSYVGPELPQVDDVDQAVELREEVIQEEEELQEEELPPHDREQEEEGNPDQLEFKRSADFTSEQINNFTNFSSSTSTNGSSSSSTTSKPVPISSSSPATTTTTTTRAVAKSSTTAATPGNGASASTSRSTSTPAGSAATPSTPKINTEWLSDELLAGAGLGGVAVGSGVTSEGEKAPFTLENANKEDELRRAESEHRSRKSKVLSAEYKHINRYINFSSDTKSLLTRSASAAPSVAGGVAGSGFYDGAIGDEGNVSSEALAIQRTYFLDAGAISAICFTVFGVCCTVGTIGIVLYRRRYLNKPQALSEPDSSVYIDDSTMRVSDNSDEMYSLDNDSFLNSLEAMTIQNYWTDTVKHTKL
ncbi:endochitinase A isoform X2 [Drosophila ficusphila]|uniref:endochitinase A isoform X2 n=1 Tax=Drosophila ficusphila TaxID=30025 RepID=UPI0007E78613|nr:endochitinase A isoform X2 [Drosophila ficusphila]